MEKKFLFLVFLVFVLVSFLSVVSAATFVNMVAPSNATGIQNISGATYTLRAWINESANVVYIRNVTWYYQAWGSSTWTQIAVTSNTSGNQSIFTATWDTTNVAEGRNYTINATAQNYAIIGANIINSTNITGNVTIDNTAPTLVIYYGPGASPTAYPNGTIIKTSTSTNLTLNISVTDATVGIGNSSAQYCFVKINNEFNHSIALNRSGSSLTTGWCNSSAINITGLSDGNHTINITVNDTLNNLRINSTFYVQIDTTAPTASATCSPSTVQTGASFPCTCSTTDATSGINSASSGGTSTSPDGTSTPSNTGVFTYTCSATDNGGLTATSSSRTYTVTQPPSTGTGGAPTTTTWTTHTITETVFEQGYTKELGVKSRIKVQIESADHFIGVVSISANQATIEISSEPVRVTLAAGEDTKVDVNDDGFYDVYVLLSGITNNKANITVQKIHESIAGEEEGGIGEEEEEAAKNLTWLWILIAVVIIAIVVWQIKARKR